MNVFGGAFQRTASAWRIDGECLLQRGIVFDIQHYAMHDGPGIRTVVFLKGCPLECRWCCNPESQSFAPELRHSSARCLACFACVRACPKGAIQAGDGMPLLDRTACRGCVAPCVDACPASALTLVGEWIDSERVMASVAADKAFYDNSGGGVTFSGGEPFAQTTFLEDLLNRSKLIGIHTAVETCGHADPRAFVRCEPLIDLYFFDLKVMDQGRHKKLTGRSNSVILENFRSLAAKAHSKLVVRVPLVPGCTDDAENLKDIAAFLCSLGISKVQLMPYHTLGVHKYASFGRNYGLAEIQCLTSGGLDEAAPVFRSSGIACDTEG